MAKKETVPETRRADLQSATTTKNSNPTGLKKVRKRDAAATRAQILHAAIEEFSLKGLPDARIEDIADRAGVNRRMIYYYYESKESLYIAALEDVYFELLEAEAKIDVYNLDPIEAIIELVRLKIEHYQKYPHFIRFVNMENLYHAKYMAKSDRLSNSMLPFAQTFPLARALEKGQHQGVFREDIEPVDLYISISALGFMYFSNIHTLGLIFGRDLTAPEEIEKRQNIMVQMISRYLLREN